MTGRSASSGSRASPVDAFSEADERILGTLASSLGVALENARLLLETRQRASELATVNQISQAAATQLELAALIELVGERAREAFDADIAYVALVDPVTERIEFPYFWEDGRAEPDGADRALARVSRRASSRRAGHSCSTAMSTSRSSGPGASAPRRSRISESPSSSATGRSARSASRAPRRSGDSATPTSGSCRRSQPTSEPRSRMPGCTRRCGGGPTRWRRSSTLAGRSPRHSSSTASSSGLPSGRRPCSTPTRVRPSCVRSARRTTARSSRSATSPRS